MLLLHVNLCDQKGCFCLCTRPETLAADRSEYALWPLAAVCQHLAVTVQIDWPDFYYPLHSCGTCLRLCSCSAYPHREAIVGFRKSCSFSEASRGSDRHSRVTSASLCILFMSASKDTKLASGLM